MANKRTTILGKTTPTAFEEEFIRVFQHHEYSLYTLALRLTKSDAYAKDVIQEVFLALWSHREQLNSIQHVEAWLYRATENKVIDFLRKAAVNERLKKALWQNLTEMNQNDAAERIETKQCAAILRRAINSLPPQRRLIYEMNREKGLSYKEIADELQLSRHTVKNQLSSALQSIRRFMDKSFLFFFF